jgi:hypothetical protein
LNRLAMHPNTVKVIIFQRVLHDSIEEASVHFLALIDASIIS